MMNTKICKACGQSNFPEADVCSNCHLNLGAKQTAGEKSSKMYWIIGGVGALIVVGAFLIVAIAAGIYFYTSSPDEVTAATNTETNSDVSAKKLADAKDVDGKNDKKNDEKDEKSDENAGNWKSTIELKHSNLGKFKLQSVTKIVEKEKMIFSESSDEAFALYSTSEKNPLEILFSIADFSTINDAKADVEAIKTKIKSTKNGKIIKESKLSDGVIISYRKNKLIGILDCKDKTCTQTTGVDGKKVSDFYKQVTDNVF